MSKYSAKYAFGEMTLRDFHKATGGRSSIAEFEFENAARSGTRPIRWGKTSLVIDMDYHEIKIPLSSKVKKIDNNVVEVKALMGRGAREEETVRIHFYEPCNANLL